MGHRNLTREQFGIVKGAARKVCEKNGLETIGDFKRIGNELIDELEMQRLDYEDLLKPEIPYEPKGQTLLG